MCWRNSQELAQESRWKKASAFSKKAQLSKTIENKLPAPRIWGKGQQRERGRKEQRESLSSSENRALHLKNTTERCMSQLARVKRTEKERRRGRDGFKSNAGKSGFQAELRHVD